MSALEALKIIVPSALVLIAAWHGKEILPPLIDKYLGGLLSDFANPQHDDPFIKERLTHITRELILLAEYKFRGPG